MIGEVILVVFATTIRLVAAECRDEIDGPEGGMVLLFAVAIAAIALLVATGRVAMLGGVS